MWLVLLATTCLLLLAVQTVGGAVASSATFDEPYHLGAGYAYLCTGDARLNNHHPPLVDAWLAVPLLLRRPRLPLDHGAWQQAQYGTFGDVFVWQANPDLALRMIWLARLPNVALALLLGAALCRWTSRLAGRSAGLLALTIYVLDPGIVANAALATNDLGVATMFFFAAWAWWEWLERPSTVRLVLAGLLAGAACTSKYSGLVVGPIAFLLALAYPLGGDSRVKGWLRRAGGLVGWGVICLLTIWAVYGFSVTDGLPAAAFWEGLRFQAGRIAGGQPVYALGRVWPNGVWFYYPLAFLLKTPLPTLLLLAAGVAVAIRRRAWRMASALGIPALVFGTTAMTSALQLGYRYLLPLLPFVHGLAGYAATAIPRSPFSSKKTGLRAATVGALVLWLALDAVAIYPHHLSFFNVLAGGAANADRYLVDSNLDWGQDLPALKGRMQERDIPFVYLGYFGSAVPDAYGVRYWPTPGFLRFVGDAESMAFNPYTPDPGWYAVSRTSLRQGLVLTHPDLYAFFRSLVPEARAGYSIDLYRIAYSPEMPTVRAVVQGERVADVSAAQLGWREGQRLIVKWVPDGNSFVLVMSGPARYLVPDALAYAPDLRDAVLRDARTIEGGLEFDARPAVESLLARWQAESPLWTPEGQPLTAPVEFAGQVRLVGYRLEQARVSAGGEVSLVLLWQISGNLMPPIASFVHLLDEDGTPQAQYDGWGSAVRGLEVGDVIVHHVQVPIPASVVPGLYRLQVGLYSPATMARWPVQTPDGTFDRVWLSEVEVVGQ